MAFWEEASWHRLEKMELEPRTGPAWGRGLGVRTGRMSSWGKGSGGGMAHGGAVGWISVPRRPLLWGQRLQQEQVVPAAVLGASG